MNRAVVIGLVVVAVVGAGLAGFYFLNPNRLTNNQSLAPAPIGQRGTDASYQNIKVDVTSEYQDTKLNIGDKTLIGSYLSQYDFWNKEIIYYNPNKDVVGKFKMFELVFNLANTTDKKYPFTVGNLGSFGETYDIQGDPGVLTIDIYIDPALVSSFTDEELAKRFSTIALSAVNFLTHPKSPDSQIDVVEPPAPFVTVTRTPRGTPINVILPADFPEDATPPPTD